MVKCWNARDPFDPDFLFQKIESEEYDWSDLRNLVRAGRLPSETNIIESVVKAYSYLKDLNNDLINVVKDSKPPQTFRPRELTLH